MPEVRPFRGIRYAASGDLGQLVCPPYDIITPEEQALLHARHPHNAVRVELPFWEVPDETKEARYRRAARCFREWLQRGVLVREEAECLYVYRQDFIGRAGSRRRVVGIIGALQLEEFGEDSGVLPHERTMPGPVEDRLALLRACPVNISPIYGIYRGNAEVAPYLDGLEHVPTHARFADEHGTLHRLWIVRARAEIEMMTGALSAHPLVIADGHHRYETALAYQDERKDTPGEHDAVMCFCVDADIEDLEILPYHRALLAEPPPAEIERRLLEHFSATRLPAGDGLHALSASGADHPMLFVLADGELLVEVSREEVQARLGDRPEAWRELDVVALHELVLPEVLPEGFDELVFSNDSREVVGLVRDAGWSAAVLLRPPRASQVIEVARSGERMPQKASYFWPKAVTGMVFRAL